MLFTDIMPAILFNAEWWDWAMLLIIPLLLGVLGMALWAIVSALATLFHESEEKPLDRRRIPDIMAFLKQRYSRTSRASRRSLLQR
jgi:hypothetical protein